MGAAREAIGSAGIDFAAMSQEERDRVGVVVNTGGGGIEQIIDGTHVHDQKGPRFVSAFAVPALSGSMAGCMISMEYGLTGPVMTQVAACATSVIAFHDALRLIATGECDVVVAGGSEAPIWPMGLAALSNMTALSKRNDSPETASRPFDATRDGFVLGEGAGIVIVESAEHALRRGATPIAEILGGALTADAFHISAPDPTGRGQTRAMVNAMRNSGVAPDEIDWIVAHGTSTSLNDVTETRAIKAAYGSAASSRAISSPKSMIGHLVGAAGIASALAALGGIRDGVISPTANLRTPDPECDLDYVPLVARPAKLDTVAINGFGFGGQNAVTIFRRFEA
jgi:3-oxoacyl-[acyl-carrier-protein] synthase II